VIRWPQGIAGGGEVRTQWSYVTDIAPTIYELAGVSMKDSYRGFEQMPLAGSSLVSTLAIRN
jgi:arylsulfatase